MLEVCCQYLGNHSGDCDAQRVKFFSWPSAAEYGPTFVEWINDSSCNVLFADQQAAKRAVFGMGKPLPPEDIPEGQSAWHSSSNTPPWLALQCACVKRQCANVAMLFTSTEGAARQCMPTSTLLPAGMETDDIGHMIEYLWHKGPDFDKDGAAVPLIFRIATVEDKKRLTADHRTRCAPPGRSFRAPGCVQQCGDDTTTFSETACRE